MHTKNDFIKRTWAEIDIDKLNYNINSIKNKLGNSTKIMAIVKANAYGHGDEVVSKSLEEIGIDCFGVSNIEEAVSLRNYGIKGDILILGYTPIEKSSMLEKYNIMQTVFSIDYANQLNIKCEKEKIQVKVHIKVDTGMNRLGLTNKDMKDLILSIQEIYNLKHINTVGVFTHFSSADLLDDLSLDYTKSQAIEFNETVSNCIREGMRFKYIHMQNSAGIVFVKDDICNYARAGIIMYGVTPSDNSIDIDIKPVMQIKSVVSMIKEVSEGVCVSYGRKYVTTKTQKIATIPIGYGDGYPRLLSNKGEVIIKGKKANVIGNVCMDQLMIDVTDIEGVKFGDIVTVIGDGDNSKNSINFCDEARKIGTIAYELMCLVSRRVPRVYLKDDKHFDTVWYI